MRLVIKHNLRGTDKPGLLSHHATYYLREPSTEPLAGPQLEQRLADQTLRELARRWYLLNGPANVPDENEALLADQPAANAPLDALIPKKGHAFEFVSDDPILAAAVDERVRRAVAMIVEDAVYAHYLMETPEQSFDLGSKEHVPSGSALPAVPQAIRNKVVEMVNR
jgi:hypothetical protein